MYVCAHPGTPETVQAILSANALPLFFEGLLRQEETIVMASARTLCTLYLSGRAPSDAVYEVRTYIHMYLMMLLYTFASCAFQSSVFLYSPCFPGIMTVHAHKIAHQGH